MRTIQSRETMGNMRIVAGVLCVAVSGCSLGMTQLPRDYDPRTIPRCDTNAIYPFGDAVGAVAATGGAVALGVTGTQLVEGSSKWVGVAGTGLVALAFAGASIGGFRWDSRCIAAKKQWDVRQIEQDTLVQQSKAGSAAPRGFYCSSSPTTATALCTREKADCERTRDVSLAAVPDLSACMLVESAWCFGDRCAPSQETCRTMLEHAQGSAADCMEVR